MIIRPCVRFPAKVPRDRTGSKPCPQYTSRSTFVDGERDGCRRAGITTRETEKNETPSPPAWESLDRREANGGEVPWRTIDVSDDDYGVAVVVVVVVVIIVFIMIIYLDGGGPISTHDHTATSGVRLPRDDVCAAFPLAARCRGPSTPPLDVRSHTSTALWNAYTMTHVQDAIYGAGSRLR